MRPSHYNYIKRMWTRNIARRKNGCCLGTILRIFALLFVLYICLIILYFVLLLSPIFVTFLIICAIVLIIDRILYFKNPLQYYKKRFNVLDEKQKNKYKSLLIEELDYVKVLANTLNTTTDIAEFVNAFNDIVCALGILTDHTYTGWVLTSPRNDLNRIKKNRHLTEIDFIKRAYFQSGSQIEIPKKDMDYIALFSADAINFIGKNHSSCKCVKEYEQANIEPRTKNKVPLKKHVSGYELELFAKQCNAYLEYEDKKKLWTSEKDEI